MVINRGLQSTSPVFAANVWVTPSQLGPIWRKNTRLYNLSQGIVRVLIHVTVLIKYRLVMDGRTDGHAAIAYVVLL